MGTPDTVVITCPECKKKTSSQTKLLGDNDLKIIKVGDKVKNFNNCIFELKNRCEHCKALLKIKIVDGIFKEETKEKTQIREGLFGDYTEW